MIITIHEAIKSLRPNKGFHMQGDDPTTVVWDDKTVITPTQSEIEAAFDDLQNEKILNEANNAQTKAALLERLGITEDEAKLLFT